MSQPLHEPFDIMRGSAILRQNWQLSVAQKQFIAFLESMHRLIQTTPVFSRIIRTLGPSKGIVEEWN